MKTCTASWAGGACTREAAVGPLCRAHYQQKYLGKPFTALQIRSLPEDPLEPVWFSLPASRRAAVAAEAGRRNQDTTEFLRDVVVTYLDALPKEGAS